MLPVKIVGNFKLVEDILQFVYNLIFDINDIDRCYKFHCETNKSEEEEAKTEAKTLFSTGALPEQIKRKISLSKEDIEGSPFNKSIEKKSKIGMSVIKKFAEPIKKLIDQNEHIMI